MIIKAKYFIWIILVIAYFCANCCVAHDIDFPRLINSPKAIGMGECSVNNIDQLSAIYNPGASGLFHLDKLAGISLPSNSRITQSEHTNRNLWMSSYGARLIEINADKSKRNEVRAAFSLAYSKNTLYYNPTYDYFPTQKWDSEHLTAAVGIEYYIKFGLGLTQKKEYYELSYQRNGPDDYSRKTNHWDYGLIVEIPIYEFIKDFWGAQHFKESRLDYSINASFAYFQAGLHRRPDFKRRGFSIDGKMIIDKKTLISFIYSNEKEYFSLNFPYSVFNRPSSYKTKRSGYETGICDFIYLRWGTIKMQIPNATTSTKGFGIRLSGLIKWLKPFDNRIQGTLIKYLYNNLDLRFDYAKYSKSHLYNYSGPIIISTKAMTFSISF